MSRVQFRISTIMLAILFVGFYFGFLQALMHVTEISGLSVSVRGRWNLPGVFIHVKRSVVRNGSPVAARIELISGESLLLVLGTAITGIVWRRGIRARRVRLDRQFLKSGEFDVGKPGSISGLARLTGPTARPAPHGSGEVEKV